MNDNKTPNKPPETPIDVSAQRQQLEKHLKDPNAKINILDLMDAAAQVGYKTAKGELIQSLVMLHNATPEGQTLPTRAFLKKIILTLESTTRG